MATRTRTAVSVFVVILALVFSAPQVWAQTAEETVRQVVGELMEQSRRDSMALQRMAAAMERLAGNPAPAAAHVSKTPTTENCEAMTDNADKAVCVAYRVEAYASARYNELAPKVTSHETRLRKVESLVGKIAPRQETKSAPAAPKSQPAASPGPVAQASANSGPGHVKMTAPEAEQFRSVAFSGDVPNQRDVDGIKNLLAGRYELAQVIWLPPPGSNDQERKVRNAARDQALDTAYGSVLATRKPADSEEERQLVAGAPKDAGVVFHLKLKKTTP